MWFPDSVKSIAERWVAGLFTELEWQIDQSRHLDPGEAGGFVVKAEGFSYGGYLKPTRLSPDNHPRAANEKIAADLAAHLGLPVSPVSLYRRPNCPQDQEPLACISLILYSQQWEWGQLAGMGGESLDVVRSVLARNSGIIAFDTFVCNTDRNNARNAIFGMNPSSPSEDSFVFLDFANSLNHNNGWSGEVWKNVKYPPVFEPMQNSVDWKIVNETIQKIETLSDETIQHIVGRIPGDYMNSEHRQTVVDGLLDRRTLIREVLEDRLGSKEI